MKMIALSGFVWFVLGIILLILSVVSALAQPLDPAWLGQPEAADYAQPAKYWQRVVAVNGGKMTLDQRAMVEDYIRTNHSPTVTQPPMMTPPVAQPEDPCMPYRYSACWDEPVGVKPIPATVYRVRQKYSGVYGWAMQVLAVISDTDGSEVVTAKWLQPPQNQQVGDVFAFKNGVGQVWQEGR